MRPFAKLMTFAAATLSAFSASALESGNKAPLFKIKTHEGKNFDLSDRKGTWTVLYFYPKAETPGCTKQACAFRDSIKRIRDLGADVFGISTDTVEAQAAFHKNHHLNFTLLADADKKVVEAYETKMPVVGIAKRQTFIIGPDLTIRHIEKDVDPVKDAGYVADVLTSLQRQDSDKKH
ncbi:MAG TPA: peroxiredoxin [Bdellovibrionales bacterium]|nr:peroxiredoxin [Bdellovibrionales bacterium]